MKILIDTYGADEGAKVLVEGAIIAQRSKDYTPVFIGNEDEITSLIDNKISDYEIINTDTYISNNEDPARAIRRKKDASIVIGYEKLKEDRYDGLITAGSTGAFLAGGLFIAGRIEGIDRACLAVTLPTVGEICLLMDSGANMDCKPEYLKEFAIMGKVFLENVLHLDNPKIGLLNVGVEEHKGNKLTKATYDLLKESDLNFIGNVESRDLFRGKVNILLADGFDGNIALKTAEGVLELFGKELKNTIYSSTKNKIAGALLKDGLKDMVKKFSSDEIGGAPLLGVKSYVYKAHGNSNEIAISNAILGLMEYIDMKVIEKIEGELL